MGTHSSRSLSVRIAEQFRKEISSQTIRRGMPAASAHEIAERYGVSVPTAHNVLNLLTEDGLLYRVQGSGTYFNRNSVEHRTSICIADQSISPEYLPPDINAFFNSHIHFACNFFREQGCDVRVLSYPELLQDGSLRGASGILTSSLFMDQKTAALFAGSGLPVVVYRYSHMDDYNFSKVCYDLDPGMNAALDSLNLQKHDRVIVIAETTPSGEYARSHWLKNLEGRVSAPTCFSLDVTEREISCYRLVRVHEALFRNAVVLTGNDEIAVSIANALTLEKILPGQDCRLVGVGDVASGGSCAAERLQLSSVNIPMRLMAEEAARLLLYKLRNNTSCIHSILVPTVFSKRNSSSCMIHPQQTSGEKP